MKIALKCDLWYIYLSIPTLHFRMSENDIMFKYI